MGWKKTSEFFPLLSGKEEAQHPQSFCTYLRTSSSRLIKRPRLFARSTGPDKLIYEG